MALLEDTNCCAICERESRRVVGGVPAYFCVACYKEHTADILQDAPWVHQLINDEKQRRKRRNRIIRTRTALVLAPLRLGVTYA